MSKPSSHSGSRAGRRPTKASAREFEWIEWIRKAEGTRWRAAVVGIGDDAAAWTPTAGHSTVATVDTQVDGVHFRSEWLTPRNIGRRAVAASVSDLAAMGARPTCLLVSLIAGVDLSTRRFRALYRGLQEAAAACSCRIAGGNISGGGPLSLSITALGECRPDRLLRRDQARCGDSIWVTGSPGLSRLGLRLLEAGRDKSDAIPRQLRSRALIAYKDPRPRLAEARAMATHWSVSAMVDISDGLFADLGHILQASSLRRRRPLGATLDPAALDKLPTLRNLASHFGESPEQALRKPSDDYELCFTTDTDPTCRQLARFRARFGIAVTRIGSIVDSPGVSIRGATVKGRGWEHLG